MVSAAALAWGGLWVHELIRVPQLLGFTSDGDIFMLVIIAALVIWWLRDSGVRPAPSAALSIYAAVGFVGAVVTVLPVTFLPFAPEQTVKHYVAHVVFASCQLPLLALSVGALRRRPRDAQSS